MMKTETQQPKNAAAEFTRPLCLSFSQDLRGLLSGFLGRSVLFALTFLSVLAVLLIFLYVIRQAVPFLTEGSLAQTAARLREFLTTNRWYPESDKAPEFGALAIVVGSAYVTVCSLVIAVPIGLLAAVFLSDIAGFRVRQVCKPIIEILAAIPSVAYGVFAVMVVAPWMQTQWGFTTGTNALNSSLILAIMALPTIISVAEDSLSAVGREIREASCGLGATRGESLLTVVIPAAHSGIIAAVILGMMRAIGETMVVWMASGNAAQIPTPWYNLLQPVRTLTATIAGDMGEADHVTGSDRYHVLFAMALCLVVTSYTLNLVSEHFVRRGGRVGRR